MKKRHGKNKRQRGTNMSKLVSGEAQPCNRPENEAEQVNGNKNARGIRGSTARSLNSKNMPKQ